MDWITIIIIVVLLYFIYIKHVSPASFNVNREELYKQIIEHQTLFDGQNYKQLKEKIPLLDASIYRGVKLLRTRGLEVTSDSLSKIL
jgi:hypothetical protein